MPRRAQLSGIGEVIFTDGGLNAATTTLAVTLVLPPTGAGEKTVLQFNVQLTTGR